MIPTQNIVAWGAVVPWADQRQVEQDLIIGRALVEIFSDDVLRDAVRVRGGTALNKLHFPKPMRYSEDIDLVRTSGGPIGPILDRLRVVLEPWLGHSDPDPATVTPCIRSTRTGATRSRTPGGSVARAVTHLVRGWRATRAAAWRDSPNGRCRSATTRRSRRSSPRDGHRRCPPRRSPSPRSDSSGTGSR